MNKSELVSFIKKECKQRNIKCTLKNTTYLKVDGVPCGGLFHPDIGLMVAMGNDHAYEILVHEYCHMTQWIEQIQEWKNHQKINSEQFDSWLAGGKCRNIKKYIKWIIELELENEKRSVKMIKKLKLDFIDINLYIKKANAYLQFYNWLLIHKSWTKPGKPMYKSKKVLSMMPAKFNMNYNKISAKLDKVMTDYYNNG